MRGGCRWMAWSIRSAHCAANLPLVPPEFSDIQEASELAGKIRLRDSWKAMFTRPYSPMLTVGVMGNWLARCPPRAACPAAPPPPVACRWRLSLTRCSDRPAPAPASASAPTPPLSASPSLAQVTAMIAMLQQ